MQTLTLHQIGLFDGLAPEQVHEVTRHLHFSRYRQGEYLFNTGEQADCLYILQDGLVKVSYVTPDGDEKILDIFEPGDIFGELFLGKYPHRIGQALAMTKTVVYRLREQEFYELIRRFPAISQNFIHHLVDEQREALARMHALLRTDARCRLLGTLLSLARQFCCVRHGHFALNPHITQEDLANLSGLNRSTVSSLINQLRREGVLGGTGRMLTVKIVAAEQIIQLAGFELLQ